MTGPCMNPAIYLFDPALAEATGQLEVRHKLPYSKLPTRMRPRGNAFLSRETRSSIRTLSRPRSAASFPRASY